MEITYIYAVLLKVFLQLIMATNHTTSFTQTNQSNHDSTNLTFTNITTRNAGIQVNISSVIHTSNKSQVVNQTVNINNMTRRGTQPTPPPEGLFVYGSITLENFCMQFKIKDSLCKCPGLSPQICSVFNRIKKKTVALVRMCKGTLQDRILIGINVIGVVANLVCFLVIINNKRNTLCRKLTGGLALVDLGFSLCSLVKDLQNFGHVHGSTVKLRVNYFTR